MNALHLAQNRYSTKKYQSKPIPSEKVEALKEILRLSPSSINIQPWKFTFIQDEAVKSRLAEASSFNESKIKQADLLVVFSVAEDLDAFQKVVDKELPEALRDWYNQGRASMPEAELKVWFSRQLYISLGMGLAGCAALGLDATPMEGISSDDFAQILNLTEYKPLIAMSVGFAAEDDYNRLEVVPKSRRALEEVVDSI
ncbi:nitroreductase family protein [Echinicola sp. CAU 1574]|uniref:Nitroreductase family protein n=1 Tax=Echinicola arenosa TaxID=2774144 RepID=A0ABR9AI80_9BACT|nr:nitroreductase family protein [Echinicola arenosa]MBD8488501.1 nitroreductase family protein [Echinicola arenosa]